MVFVIPRPIYFHTAVFKSINGIRSLIIEHEVKMSFSWLQPNCLSVNSVMEDYRNKFQRQHEIHPL